MTVRLTIEDVQHLLNDMEVVTHAVQQLLDNMVDAHAVLGELMRIPEEDRERAISGISRGGLAMMILALSSIFRDTSAATNNAAKAILHEHRRFSSIPDVKSLIGDQEADGDCAAKAPNLTLVSSKVDPN